MSKKKKNTAAESNDFLAEEAKQNAEQALDYTLDIPDDEIWTYQIEGLQAPHINQPFKNAKIKKVIVVITLLIAIGAAIFLSVRAVHSDLYKYKELEDGTYELVKFSNRGDIKDITIDYVVDLETGEKDYSKPISVIHEYAFNCDEILNSITFGKDVKSIDGKSIYSCWWVTNVFVDDENPYYCDIDGVLYNKDVTEIVFYPNDHDRQLRLENGYAEIGDDGVQHSLLVDDEGNEMEELWGTTKKYDEKFFQEYNRNTRTYVIPSTVTTIGELAFAYSNIVDLYIPEGVTRMENMAVFKNTVLTNIYSYKTEAGVSDTTYKGIDKMSEIYASLPEGLEFIGSDCLYYTRGLAYMYVPSSVKEIKHHAFWDSAFKEDKELRGVTVINTGYSQSDFEANVKTGDQWRPQYDYMLFKKSIDINYDAQRESQLAYNIHRQYYWAVQWMINNLPDDVKAGSAYLVQDMDNDGTPELVLRKLNTETNANEDTIITFSYGYLTDYEGDANYDSATFSELTDNAQLDSILK